MTLLKRLWTAISGERWADDSQKVDATAEELRRMLKCCPACEGGWFNHTYVSFAIMVIGEDKKDRVLALLEALKDHRWKEAQTFQEFDPLRDALEAFALRCCTGRIGLLIVRNPEELWESHSLIADEVLDLEAGHELAALIDPNNWRPLTWTSHN